MKNGTGMFGLVAFGNCRVGNGGNWRVGLFGGGGGCAGVVTGVVLWTGTTRGGGGKVLKNWKKRCKSIFNDRK